MKHRPLRHLLYSAIGYQTIIAMTIGGIRVANLIRISNKINIRHGSSSTHIYIVLRLIGKYNKNVFEWKISGKSDHLFDIAVCCLLSCSWIAPWVELM